MKKNLIFKILGFIVFLVMAYIFFLSYLLSNGFRDYEDFCSKYIPQLENYHKSHGSYPETLNNFKKSKFDFRYELEECGYSREEKGYIFYFSEGFGMKGYSSIRNEWWSD